MSATNDIHPHAAATAVKAGEEVLEVTGAGTRVVELAAVAFLGLLVCPPLLIFAVVVAVPALAVGAVVAAVVAAIAVPTMLVRRVRAHHREHGSTLFLHRLRRP